MRVWHAHLLDDFQRLSMHVATTLVGNHEIRAHGNLCVASVFCADHNAPLIPLSAPERACIDGAHGMRKREFHVGRTCAKYALGSLMHSEAERISIGQKQQEHVRRAPQWPTGVVGSISHTRYDEHVLSVAVCAQTLVCESIGIDVQVKRTINPHIIQRLLRQDEKLHEWGACSNDALITLFSIKESIYKALAPLSTVRMSLFDVRVNKTAHGFDAVVNIQRDADTQLTQVIGCVATLQTSVLTMAVVPPVRTVW